jgi:hypothetical protein
MIRFVAIGLLFVGAAGCTKQSESRVDVTEEPPAAPAEPTTPGRKLMRFEHPITHTITVSTTLNELPTEVHNVAVEEQSRLRVEWKPIRTVERDGETFLQVRGRLLLSRAAGEAPKPVDWPQPVRVLFAREPGAELDWSEYLREDDTAFAETAIAWRWVPTEPAPGPGEFLAEFPTHAVRRPLAKTGKFQLGLCLGSRVGNELRWTDRTPVLPQSMTTVVLAGPATMSESVRLIHACPSQIGWRHDPVALIRAANHLRSLGKKRAIFALRDYLRLARDRRHGRLERNADDIETADVSSLDLLVPLAFGATDGPRADEWRNRGHLISLAGDIPFHTIRFDGGSGGPPRVAWLIDWAEADGQLRDKPLRPTDRPLDAADELFNRIATPQQRESRSWPRLKEHLRWQALGMVYRLLGEDNPPTVHDKRLHDEEGWSRLKARAIELGIRWDEQRQEYVRPGR